VEMPLSLLPFARPSTNDVEAHRMAFSLGELTEFSNSGKIGRSSHQQDTSTLIPNQRKRITKTSGSGSLSEVVNKGNNLRLTNANPFLLA
jgi:hypothetical protein